jgi:hypothetical protein
MKMEKQAILVENFFVLNGAVKPIAGFSYTPPINAKIIYEVIRAKSSSPYLALLTF